MSKCYLYCTLLLLFNLPSFVHAQSLINYQTAFNGSLKNWTQTFVNFKLSDFKQTAQAQKFENINSVKAKSKTAFYPGYKAALSTSPNGCYTIDIYSYLLLDKKNGKFITTGSDVEQNISLGYVRDSEWKRIAYYGYAQRVQEVTWVNNDTFILAAARLNKADKNIPVIIVGQIRQQILTTYETSNPGCYQKVSGYTSQKLQNLLHGKRKS
ncbi:hypothetical protein MTO98_23985 [Mucilaginibacter sp. SMC90]|uniref:hypothetical protein n=1 Tax=Mucilaginibacter sp. SMC90 TaxID=2929803 RepID=UPI001FB4AE72|nr:hypothetical protein [Mucilaginibacter sp. SMC90]UOE47472.1 hypothetical protein MTO98_23985 [Mucilaginibacter sp. SMC90]